jgi:heat shock protein HslJ
MIREYFGGTILICCLLFACSTTPPQKTPKEAEGVLITPQLFEKIVGIDWHLIRMTLDGEPYPMVENSEVTFACSQEGQVAGAASINRYFGNLKLAENGGIVWNKVFGMTRMAGPPELMKQESVFMDALSKTSRMFLNNSTLILKSQDRSTVLEFDRVEK